MESAVAILTSDAMIIVYEVVGIIVFGGFDVFLGKKKKAAKLEKEKEILRRQEKSLQESLTNTRKR